MLLFFVANILVVDATSFTKQLNSNILWLFSWMNFDCRGLDRFVSLLAFNWFLSDIWGIDSSYFRFGSISWSLFLCKCVARSAYNIGQGILIETKYMLWFRLGPFSWLSFVQFDIDHWLLDHPKTKGFTLSSILLNKLCFDDSFKIAAPALELSDWLSLCQISLFDLFLYLRRLLQ